MRMDVKWINGGDKGGKSAWRQKFSNISHGGDNHPQSESWSLKIRLTFHIAIKTRGIT